MQGRRSQAKNYHKNGNAKEMKRKSSFFVGFPHHVVFVISVKEWDAVGVKVDGVPLLKALLETGDPPDGDHQVGREHHQHDRLHPLQ